MVVRPAAGQTIIEWLNPQIMVQVADQPSLKPVADEATSRIRAALNSLKTPAGQHAEDEFGDAGQDVPYICTELPASVEFGGDWIRLG